MAVRKVFAAASALLFAATTAHGQQASAFPPGPGREIVATACVQCHTAQPFAQIRMSEAAWRKQVQNMVLRGAMIGPDDLDSVAKYLATNYGPGVPIPNQPKVEVNLPAGPGATLVGAGCGICHGLDRVAAVPRPGRQWDAIVHRMIELGAPLNDDEAQQIVAYLQANYANP